MYREDYLLRQTRDLAKFLAILVGFAKKGDTEQAVKVIDQALKGDFDLDQADFLSLKNNRKIEALPAEDLKTIGELLLQKATLQPESTTFLRQVAEHTLRLYEEKSEVFDLSKM